MKNPLLPLIAAASTAILALSASPAHSASLVSQLGILDLNANGGINPATGAAWAAGDTYRLVFVTSATRNATSTDIADYNNFVQGVANSSSLGLGSATWKVIASTETVNARVNTSTLTGVGEPIFLIDGSTVIANNYADLWNGLAVGTQAINLTEEASPRGGVSVFAGTSPSGNTITDRWLGTVNISNNALRVETGRTDANTTGRWIQQFNANPNSSLSFYALSDPLTITLVPEPTRPLLIGLSVLGFLARRRRP